VLFEGSIRENLLIGKPQATEKELRTACEQAQAWEFIQKYEKKLDTFVGKDGH